MRCHALGAGVIATGEIACFGAFYLDHSRAQIRQLPRGKGGRDRVFQCDNGYSG